MDKVNKVVLAYSGGLDTSVILPWLKENYGCEVITFTANLGQGDEELEGLEKKALDGGATKAHILDLREEFLSEYAFPTMQAGAIYERAIFAWNIVCAAGHGEAHGQNRRGGGRRRHCPRLHGQGK